MASQMDAVNWYKNNVLGKHNTYSHSPGGLGKRFLRKDSSSISTDCSGSTWAAYKEACGISIGMDCGTLAASTGQWVDGPIDSAHKPNISLLAPGDLLLFRGKTPGRPHNSSHVEMYLGDGMCAGCGSTKIVKPGSCTSDSWTKKYIGAKRIIVNGAVVGGSAGDLSGYGTASSGGSGGMGSSGGAQPSQSPYSAPSENVKLTETNKISVSDDSKFKHHLYQQIRPTIVVDELSISTHTKIPAQNKDKKQSSTQEQTQNQHQEQNQQTT